MNQDKNDCVLLFLFLFYLWLFWVRNFFYLRNQIQIPFSCVSFHLQHNPVINPANTREGFYIECTIAHILSEIILSMLISYWFRINQMSCVVSKLAEEVFNLGMTMFKSKINHNWASVVRLDFLKWIGLPKRPTS